MKRLLQTEAEVTYLIFQAEAEFAILEVNKKYLTCKTEKIWSGSH